MNRTLRWRNRLGAKLAALIALLTLVIVGFFALMAVRVQRQYAVAEVKRGATHLLETVKSAIYHHMLADERRFAYLTMDTIGRQRGIDSVRMYNATGAITYSKHASEVGISVDRKAAACVGCHGATLPEDALPDRSALSRTYEAPDGHRVLGLATPVLNEKSCYTAACHAHPEDQKVLGVLDLGLSLEEADQGILTLERQTLAIAAGSTMLLICAVLLFVRASVLRPVRDLVEGTRRVAVSDLLGEIPVRSDDELGLLARSFNEMIASLRHANQEIRGLMGSLEAQVEERTAALKQAQDQLVQSEKMSSLGKLSASIAHEINNPLMGILTIAKLLIRSSEGDSGPAHEVSLKQLRMVQRETERCSAIVRNLLDFARQRPLALQEIDVNAPLEEALSVAANQMSIQGVKLERSLGPGALVHADLGQLRQAFLNVALNAVEAMPKGGALKVASRAVEARVEVEITDTGSGITPEALGKIFDPFFTTKEKGTGLGLSVVFGIVQRHGGTLDVKSQPGQGTRFTIVLPRQTAGAAPGQG